MCLLSKDSSPLIPVTAEVVALNDTYKDLAALQQGLYEHRVELIHDDKILREVSTFLINEVRRPRHFEQILRLPTGVAPKARRQEHWLQRRRHSARRRSP